MNNPFKGHHTLFNKLLNEMLSRGRERGRIKVLAFFQDVFRQLSMIRSTSAKLDYYIDVFLNLTHDQQQLKHPRNTDAFAFLRHQAYDMTIDRLQAALVLYKIASQTLIDQPFVPLEIREGLYKPCRLQMIKQRCYVTLLAVSHTKIYLLEAGPQIISDIEDTLDLSGTEYQYLKDFFDTRFTVQLNRLYKAAMPSSVVGGLTTSDDYTQATFDQIEKDLLMHGVDEFYSARYLNVLQQQHKLLGFMINLGKKCLTIDKDIQMQLTKIPTDIEKQEDISPKLGCP